MSGDDAAVIRTKVEALAQAAMKLGEAMYKASQEAAAGGGAEAAGAGAEKKAEDSTVVDADFEEVQDDKKNKSA
jgi:molecular chaperone DnaK